MPCWWMCSWKRTATAPAEIVLDLDATDTPLHGQQEGRFFHGFYDEYCYLPLYIFCGEQLLARGSGLQSGRQRGRARRSPADRRARSHRWPKVKIILRGDSGFCREELMGWCEDTRWTTSSAWRATTGWRRIAELHGRRPKPTPADAASGAGLHRVSYQTRNSWTRARRVVAKAEIWTRATRALW